MTYCINKLILFAPKRSIVTTLLLLGIGSAARAQVPTIVNVSPARNGIAASPTGPVSQTFSQPINSASATTIKLFSSQYGGQRTRTANTSGNTTTLLQRSIATRVPGFQPGELLRVTVPATVQSTTGQFLAPYVYQFNAAVAGTGRGMFTAGADVSLANPPGDVATADLDSDGDLDLLAPMSNFLGTLVAVRLNDGNGNFATGSDVRVGITPIAIAPADVDGDGDLDMLVTCLGDGSVSVRLNNGQGVFSGGSDVLGFTSPTRVTTADLDGDGDLDMLVYHSTTIVSIRFNNGQGIFSGGSNLAMSNGAGKITVGDVDNDGDLDLLNTAFTAGTLLLRLNQGNGTFGAPILSTLSPNTSDATLADMDNDGDLDLVVTNARSNSVQVWHNTGTGSFAAGASASTGNYPTLPEAVDLDRDGDLDLVTVNLYGNNATVCFNNGQGILSTGADYALGTNPRGLAVADLDGDGDVDFLAATSQSTGNIKVRFNQGPVVPVCPPTDSTVVAITPAGIVSLRCGQTESELRLRTTQPAGTRYEWQFISPTSSSWQVLATGIGLATYKATQAGRYRVRVLQGNCEMISPATELRLENTYTFRVPTIFTPNNDQLNDRFELRLQYPRTFSLQVFNHWGRRVYSTDKYGDFWTGADAPAGVYYYLWRYSTECEPVERVVKGNITLAR